MIAITRLGRCGCRALAVVAVGVLATAVLRGTAGADRALAASDREVLVTRSSMRLPAGCAPRKLASLVDRFFEAFNSGEWRDVDVLFAGGGPRPEDFKLFAWKRDVIQARERLTPYLATLRDGGERFRLLSLEARRESGLSSSVALEYVFERPSGRGAGKGLIECRSLTIWQWAMAPSSRVLASACPQPGGWSPSGPIVACTAGPNARALSADFRVGKTRVELPKSCRPAAVRQRVRSALVAFNLGAADAFARSFVARGRFRPYTASFPGAGLVGRSRLGRFVSVRYGAGDGWTATALLPPQGTIGLPSRAVYDLEFQLSFQGELVTKRAFAKLVVSCRSGLLESWIGPALKTPSFTR